MTRLFRVTGEARITEAVVVPFTETVEAISAESAAAIARAHQDQIVINKVEPCEPN